MYLANNINGNRVYIDEADKENKYFCPLCGSEVIVKHGSVRIPHFAHKSNIECDDWSNDMSEWHKNWQNQFPVASREVIIENDNKIHRADICISDTIIEFQHSYINAEEFEARNQFYRKRDIRWFGFLILRMFGITRIE